MIKANDRNIVITLSCIRENYTLQRICISLFQWFHKIGMRYIKTILQPHPMNHISYPYSRPDTLPWRQVRSRPCLKDRSDTLTWGQARDPALRAGQIPCPGSRSEILPLVWVKYPILHIVSVQVKYLTPKHCLKGTLKTLPSGQVRDPTILLLLCYSCLCVY